MMSKSKGLDSLIEATIKGLIEKSDFSSRWCEKYTEDCVEKLKDYAHKSEDCGQICEYCQTFKWVIDRAKHYEKNLGIGWEDVLASWEEDRNYWYMNYYQGSNQREIISGETKVFETVDKFRESVGNEGFRCPACGDITSNPHECNSRKKNNTGKVCNWKSYGLFGNLGKGVFVYCKKEMRGDTIFMPVAWEEVGKNHDNPELLEVQND